MDAANCEQACSLVSKSYVSQGQQALARRHRLVKTLLSSRRLPDHGWDEPTIEMFVQVRAARAGWWEGSGRHARGCISVVCMCLPSMCTHALEGACCWPAVDVQQHMGPDQYQGVRQMQVL